MTYISLAISIGAVVLGIVNHRRIRSTCCGASGSLSLDIESTTPTKTEPLVNAVHSSSSQGRIQSEEECARPLEILQQITSAKSDSECATSSDLSVREKKVTDQ